MHRLDIKCHVAVHGSTMTEPNTVAHMNPKTENPFMAKSPRYEISS